MNNHPIKRAALLAVGITAGLSIAFTPAVAAAQDDVWECTSSGGVWVVVSNDDWQKAGCASKPATGQEALTQAGFDLQFDQSGFLCQIDNFPAECPSKPAMDAYWSYWQANPAGKGFTSWDYATTGPAESKPAPGSLEGWWFGDSMNNKPVLPDYVPAGATAPDATTSPSADRPAPSASASDSTAGDHPEPAPAPAKQSSGLIGWIILGVALVAGGGWFGWTRWQRSRR